MRGHDRLGQDRPLRGRDRGSRAGRRALDRDRPQGRPRQPHADVPRAGARRLPALDQRGRRRQGRASRRTTSPSRSPSCGRRASPTGVRTGRASSRCATRPTSRSTRRAATPACPSRCSDRSRRRRIAPTPRRSATRSARSPRGSWRCSASTPIRSRAASTSCSRACSARPGPTGQSLDIAALIAQIQQPPFAKIGVLDLDSFYPQKDRFELALALNNLLAAPGFQLWMQGAPLDIGSFLRSDAGKPRVAIFSIAHLSDAERMFFVTLLLNAVLAWMRGQSGTTSLRALVYMDEIFGYFPPVGGAAVEEAAPDAAQAGARVRRGRAARHAEPGRPRLQGALERRHVADRPAPDRPGQAARAGRAGGRLGSERARPPGAREAALGARQPRLPAQQRARERARWCSRRAGRCRTCAARSRGRRSPR